VTLGLLGVGGTGLQYDLGGRLLPVRAVVEAVVEAPAPVEVSHNQGRFGGGRQQPLKESRRRLWSRKSRRLKRPKAGYLDVMQYYKLFASEEQYNRVFWCGRSWDLYWKEGEEKSQLCMKGCSERTWCPGCCVYHRDMLAVESAELSLRALEGLEITHGVVPGSYGIKVVATIPKETSVWIDNSPDRLELLGKLFKANVGFLKGWYGEGVGGLAGLDFAGESAPTEAHYHANSYLFPARKLKEGWVALPHWTEKKDFPAMRRLWFSMVKKYLGDVPGLEGLEELDVNIGYLREREQVHHFLRYMWRSPLFDLWKGWQSGSLESGIDYEYWKRGKSVKLHLETEAVASALGRVAGLTKTIVTKKGAIRDVTFKRVRWFGCLSDNQKGVTMGDLGLEVKEEDWDPEEAGWVYDSGPYFLDRYTAKGIVVRHRDTDVVVDSTIDGVLVNYAPKGVMLGKRQRWRQPGEI